MRFRSLLSAPQLFPSDTHLHGPTPVGRQGYDTNHDTSSPTSKRPVSQKAVARVFITSPALRRDDDSRCPGW